MTEENINPNITENTEEPAEMSFWDHLNELRGVIIKSLIAVFIGAILAFANKDIIFDKIILAPKDPNFITFRALCAFGKLFHFDGLCVGTFSLNLVNLNMAGQFMSHLTISLVAGIVISVPYILWQLWKFISPALYDNEQSYSKNFVFICSTLFMIGVLFSYYLIVPLTINFFATYQVSTSVVNQIALESYISSVTSLCLSMGIVFEMPVLIFFLTKIGVLTPQVIRKYRRHAFVVVMIIAAIITPTADAFSLTIVTLPLYALYEASYFVSKLANKKPKA